MKNYIRKEKILQESLRLGLDYRVLTRPTFDFLLEIKKQLAQTNGGQEADFKQVFEKYIEVKNINQDTQVLAIEFDNLFDGLFMKLKIKVPPKDSLEQLKLLLAVKFGLQAKNDFILVHKIERILHDLDFVYVNLIKALRDPEAAKLQKEAMARLSQRFDLVARSISQAPKPKKEASQP